MTTLPRIGTNSPVTWSEWDKCSVTCGSGTRIRSKPCDFLMCSTNTLRQVEVCNDFQCDIDVCEDDYFDLVLLVHQSEKGTRGQKNWEYIVRFIKKLLKSFRHTDPSISTYRLSIFVYGKVTVQLVRFGDFDRDRTSLFDFLDTLFDKNKKLVLNNDAVGKPFLGQALFFVENLIDNNELGLREGGVGGVPTIVGIITDELETSTDERTQLKERAIELKARGIERVFGVGVANAHDWSQSKIRKTWKAIVTRPAFERNLILVKRHKTLSEPGGSWATLSSRLCNTESADKYCSSEHGFLQHCFTEHQCVEQHTG